MEQRRCLLQLNLHQLAIGEDEAVAFGVNTVTLPNGAINHGLLRSYSLDLHLSIWFTSGCYGDLG